MGLVERKMILAASVLHISRSAHFVIRGLENRMAKVLQLSKL